MQAVGVVRFLDSIPGKGATAGRLLRRVPAALASLSARAVPMPALTQQCPLELKLPVHVQC